MPSQSRRGQNKAHGTDGWNIAYARPTEDARVWQAGQRQTRTPACPRAIAARALCSRARRTRAPFALPALLHCRGACAWLAARSAATCIKTSTRPTVTHLTKLYFFGHSRIIVSTFCLYVHLIKMPCAAKTKRQSNTNSVLYCRFWNRCKEGFRYRILPSLQISQMC